MDILMIVSGIFETVQNYILAPQNYFLKSKIELALSLNPNWHEGGHIPPFSFWIRFCQLIFYQIIANYFRGGN